MITFICVLFTPGKQVLPRYSRGYDAAWVDKLFRGCARHYRRPFRFVCLHDGKGYEFEEPVEPLLLNDPEAGWATLVEAWRPEIAEGQRFVMGLDTVITGDLTAIVEHETDCGLLTDPYKMQTVCNGVGSYSEQGRAYLWKEWTTNREKWAKESLYGGHISEMVFLRKVMPQAERLDRVFPGQILSYKAHIIPTPAQWSDARIVYFHGEPKPPNIKEEWILEQWV